MIVRHPFHRLVSCYRNKFELGSKLYYYERYGEQMVRAFRSRPPGVTKQEVTVIYLFLIHLQLFIQYVTDYVLFT